jgi:cyanocobalamin reductase (cyanide-eliminating) / alkylcobalamin dealkylase
LVSSLAGPAGQAIAELRRGCEAAGFDLVQPLQVGWYNAIVSGSLRLEDFGSSTHLAVVIGNTRALWPKFLAALRADAALLASPHPLYRYTELAISAACAGLPQPLSLRWSHAGGSGLVAMQRLAHVAGLAYLSESQLSVHAAHGPWIGLRAAVSFALPGPSGPPPQLPHPCGSCAGQCRPAFEQALAATSAALTEAGVQHNWQLWLACRDACPTGRAQRYDEAQIRYHYLKDRQQLRDACLASARPG